MSYSLIAPCSTCSKNNKCSDYQVLGGAVSAIHSMGSQKGHLGAGSIELKCMSYEQSEASKPTTRLA